MSDRYLRQVALPEIGAAGQERLRRTSVLIVGAGGLGCPLLSYLGAAGVGRLTIVDPDRVEESNLHRQVLYGSADLGRLKAEAAAVKIRNLNPDCQIEAIVDRLSPVNAEALVAKADLVADAADSFAVTYMLSDAALALGKTLVSASVAGFSGYVGAFCGGAPSYRALFPDMPERLASCSTTGVIGSAVGVVGSLQAQMLLQLVLDLEPSPLGRLVSMDFLKLTFGGFSFQGAAEPPAGFRFIDRTQLRPDDLVIDLRSREEAPLPLTARALRHDVNEIDSLVTEDLSQRVVLCCRSGVRAWRAGRRLKEMGADQIALIALGG
jgi:molybdopterin/thiamine biosynthesis adenylyltransferase